MPVEAVIERLSVSAKIKTLQCIPTEGEMKVDLNFLHHISLKGFRNMKRTKGPEGYVLVHVMLLLIILEL